MQKGIMGLLSKEELIDLASKAMSEVASHGKNESMGSVGVRCSGIVGLRYDDPGQGVRLSKWRGLAGNQ